MHLVRDHRELLEARPTAQPANQFQDHPEPVMRTRVGYSTPFSVPWVVVVNRVAPVAIHARVAREADQIQTQDGDIGPVVDVTFQEGGANKLINILRLRHGVFGPQLVVAKIVTELDCTVVDLCCTMLSFVMIVLLEFMSSLPKFKPSAKLLVSYWLRQVIFLIYYIHRQKFRQYAHGVH